MIGILGGTFDPVHHGHLRVALEVRQRLHMESVHLIPSARPPHRGEPQASAELRFQMLQVAIVDTEGLLADDRELRRPGASYMVDTLAELRAEKPQQPLALILGMDAFRGLHHWHQWQKLIEFAHLVVVYRPETSIPIEPEIQQFLVKYQTRKPKRLRQQLSGRVLLQEIPALTVSSTRIRMQVANGENPRYLLPDASLALITQHQLYMKA
ncbi:nicotinate-nucleotide adenylyltransferase [Candidatus Venteria ishoeyi]|uniref:Probable nicotinate-nucleotide adenylyltransferase n=1 Tax=Candidatus Venteria ishoeyi TaxID=1899563 RepID=A0A1H6FA88_9GAMM|nr:nicotinate-nucleotide adenylyltransferase [Candidatus Venteria ishoeyi]SEH07008.1 putative nicotinate-nucleotide adenylyltransferase [Candidatus Venteria ishoeyi]